MDEEGIRYFQIECVAFSSTVLVELYDIVGTNYLYYSSTEKNPGSFTQDTVANDTVGITLRTCVVTLNTSVGVFFTWGIQW